MARGRLFGATFKRAGWRHLLLYALLFAVIMMPFALTAKPIQRWTDGFTAARLTTDIKPTTDRLDQNDPSILRSTGVGEVAAAFVLITLLSADVLLPIPSSLVSTAAGGLYGLWLGTLLSVVGMTLSCVVGYWLGAGAGRYAASRLVGNKELVRLEEMHQQCGQWMVVIARSIPVLAEASTLVAGMSRMPWGRFMLLTACSNLGISLVYTSIGVYSVYLNSFVYVFVGATLVPAIVLFIWSNAKRYRRVNPSDSG